MVSYTQLDQHGIKQVLVSSSGRPKAQSLQQEDADFFYYYDRRGGLISKNPKTNLQKHAYWYKNNVRYEGNCRQTALTPFEKAIGVRSCIPEYRYKHCSCGLNCGCQTHTYTENEWQKFMQTHTIDYGNLQMIYSKDMADHIGQGNYNWDKYFREKAGKLNLEVVSISALEFREKQKPAVVEKVRPNPKEVKKVEPVEVEPIKEVVKYSPLMIAGVIAVVVILFLKRRRA